MGEINQARRHSGRSPHPDTPYFNSGSYGGWRACQICIDKRGGGTVLYIPPEARAWHEKTYTEMWEDFITQEQT